MGLQDLPSGSIIAWDNSSIPSGWLLCDGNNGTPDLRDTFIYGASADGEIRNTGGADTHQHASPDVVSIASHTHGGSASKSVSNGSSINVNTVSGATSASVGHSHNFNMTIAGGGAHGHTVGLSGFGSNLPQHVVRLYIRKT